MIFQQYAVNIAFLLVSNIKELLGQKMKKIDNHY